MRTPPTTALDGNRATAHVVVDELAELGRDLHGEGEVYLNVPQWLLENGTLLDLPTDGLVLEVLQDVTDPGRLRPVLERYRAAGFRLTLDDLVPHDPRLELAGFVDICKVDLRAVAAGASLLQGYLLARPSQLRGFRPTILADAELDLPRAVREGELDLSRVEDIIGCDVGLADHFLRRVHLHAGWREVESIHHGLVLLGHRNLTR